jgi:hypothetical protein
MFGQIVATVRFNGLNIEKIKVIPTTGLLDLFTCIIRGKARGKNSHEMSNKPI